MSTYTVLKLDQDAGVSVGVVRHYGGRFRKRKIKHAKRLF